jgi:hypothetical protein
LLVSRIRVLREYKIAVFANRASKEQVPSCSNTRPHLLIARHSQVLGLQLIFNRSRFSLLGGSREALLCRKKHEKQDMYLYRYHPFEQLYDLSEFSEIKLPPNRQRISISFENRRN